jgi:hypothetical protein
MFCVAANKFLDGLALWISSYDERLFVGYLETILVKAMCMFSVFVFFK